VFSGCLHKAAMLKAIIQQSNITAWFTIAMMNLREFEQVLYAGGGFTILNSQT